MPSGFYITEKSIKELERAANQLIKEVHEGETAILLAAANKVKTAIKQKAASLQKSEKQSAQKAAYAIAYPPKLTQMGIAYAGIRPRKMPHGHLVEHGHGGTHPAPPHPFVRPAWDETKDQVERDIAAGLGKVIEGAL